MTQASTKPRIPFRRRWKQLWKNLRILSAAPLAYPPGHFYSPITDQGELALRYRDLRQAAPHSLPGVALDRQGHLDLWRSWAPFLREPRPGATSDARYTPENDQYGMGDALVQSCILRHFKPQRMIEIGSGHSSAAALDTIDAHLGGQTRCTFIDPYPKRLNSVLRGADRERHQIIEKPVQDIDPDLVAGLEANDILFIDSTHIVKTASDVVFDLFELLPRVRKGVIVHFHDMFWPFEYPPQWVVDMNLSWNELYALRAFLSWNDAFEIVFFNDYLWTTARNEVDALPPGLSSLGGGLWLRRR